MESFFTPQVTSEGTLRALASCKSYAVSMMQRGFGEGSLSGDCEILFHC